MDYNVPMILHIHTDGGARGNPGIAGCGVVITNENNDPLYQKGIFLGVKTNNEAEYAGLIHGLEWIITHQKTFTIDRIEFFLDSELVVRQLNGKYKVKSPHLVTLYRQALELCSTIAVPIIFNHVRRELNAQADLLANDAMDQRYNQ